VRPRATSAIRLSAYLCLDILPLNRIAQGDKHRMTSTFRSVLKKIGKDPLLAGGWVTQSSGKLIKQIGGSRMIVFVIDKGELEMRRLHQSLLFFSNDIDFLLRLAHIQPLTRRADLIAVNLLCSLA